MGLGVEEIRDRLSCLRTSFPCPEAMPSTQWPAVPFVNLPFTGLPDCKKTANYHVTPEDFFLIYITQNIWWWLGYFRCVRWCLYWRKVIHLSKQVYGNYPKKSKLCACYWQGRKGSIPQWHRPLSIPCPWPRCAFFCVLEPQAPKVARDREENSAHLVTCCSRVSLISFPAFVSGALALEWWTGKWVQSLRQ